MSACHTAGPLFSIPAMDGRIMWCGSIRWRQSVASFQNVKRFWARDPCKQRCRKSLTINYFISFLNVSLALLARTLNTVAFGNDGTLLAEICSSVYDDNAHPWPRERRVTDNAIPLLVSCRWMELAAAHCVHSVDRRLTARLMTYPGSHTESSQPAHVSQIRSYLVTATNWL